MFAWHFKGYFFLNFVIAKYFCFLTQVITIPMDFHFLNFSDCKFAQTVCKLICDVLLSREKKTTRLMGDRVADLEMQVKDSDFLIFFFIGNYNVHSV